jgi:hypothetical protein
MLDQGLRSWIHFRARRIGFTRASRGRTLGSSIVGCERLSDVDSEDEASTTGSVSSSGQLLPTVANRNSVVGSLFEVKVSGQYMQKISRETGM